MAPRLPKPGLLVSVRSAKEAGAALEGGADLIDVKEPAHGSLGRAGDETIRAVIERVAGKRPITAAMGELVEGAQVLFDTRLRYVKWGLAGSQSSPGPAWPEAVQTKGWQAILADKLSRRGNPQA